MSKKILIIGHARHGKDTVAGIIKEITGMTYASSSEVANEVFIFDLLKDKYGYKTKEECFEDRISHRTEWFDLICAYNKEDKARLAKDILQRHDIYVGMRNNEELQECKCQGLFDLIIGVYDTCKEHEPKESFDIDLFEEITHLIATSENMFITRKQIEILVADIKPK